MDTRAAKIRTLHTTASAYATVTQIKDGSSMFHTKRLNPSLPHLPLPIALGGLTCALCRWATGKKSRAQLSHCEGCNITLCVWCYKPFHTVKNLESKKARLCQEILDHKTPTTQPLLSMRNRVAAEKRKQVKLAVLSMRKRVAAAKRKQAKSKQNNTRK